MTNILTMTEITKIVGETLNMDPAQLKKRRRLRQISHARHMACALIRRHTTRSFPEIARFFEYADHTTVYEAVKKMPERLRADSTARRKFAEADAKIRRLKDARRRPAANLPYAPRSKD